MITITLSAVISADTLEEGNTVTIDVFKFSFCPYAKQLEKTLSLIERDFRGLIEFTPNFIVWTDKGSCMNKLCTLNPKAEQELTLDVVEYCIQPEL